MKGIRSVVESGANDEERSGGESGKVCGNRNIHCGRGRVFGIGVSATNSRLCSAGVDGTGTYVTSVPQRIHD